MTKWCERQGHEVVKIVQDEESGRTPLADRKKFLKLLEGSRHGEIDAIAVYTLDRLTRNWDDVTLIEEFFRRFWDKCKLIATNDVVDLSNATGRFMFRVRMVIACYEPELMRERQKIGIARAKLEGKYKGGSKGRRWTYG